MNQQILYYGGELGAFPFIVKTMGENASVFMKVLLADDHTIVRQGLRSLLETEMSVEVIGEAADGREAFDMTDKFSPDVVIMDIAMPKLNGLDAISQIKEKLFNTNVIVLSMYVEEIYVLRALRAGASGYVLKDSAYEELALALKAVNKNEIFLGSKVSQVLVSDYLELCPLSSALSKYEKLTQREKETLQLLVEGHNRSKIASILLISIKTVDRHQENLKKKLDINTDKDLTEFAKSIGIIV